MSRPRKYTPEQNSERAKNYRKNNKEKVAAIERASQYRKRYGITPEQYCVLLEIAHHKCEICGAATSFHGHRLAVDHNHTTKKVRGILCKSCNTGVGYFKDSPELLKKASAYLEAKDG